MIIVDTSAVLSALFPEQNHHQECALALARDGFPILSPFVLAEIDYMIEDRVGVEEELRFLGDVRKGTYELAPFGPEELHAAVAVIEQYRSLRIGLADASIVVLAERYGTRDILTLDERHFRVLRPLTGRESFRLLPADL